MDATDDTYRRTKTAMNEVALSGIEVSGQSVDGTLGAFKNYKAMPNRYLLAEGMGTAGPDGNVVIDPGKWYPLDSWLRAFGRIGQEVGPTVLAQIGASVMQNIQWPPGMNSVEGLIRFIDVGYHMHHRKDGKVMFDGKTGTMLPGIGNFSYKGEDKNRYLVECANSYPCSFDKGILGGALRKLGTGTLAVHDTTTECRSKGGKACTYVVFKSKN